MGTSPTPAEPAAHRFGGILLAAGAGSRMGRPKALVRAGDGTPWLRLGVEVLAAVADEIVVVLGCAAAQAAPLLPDDPRVRVVVADDWAQGMGASLRAGLAALDRPDDPNGCAAALVHLVDLPDVRGPIARAVLAQAATAPGGPAAVLARAAYGGKPGHPVLLGRDHWRPLAATLAGDAGARGYLSARSVSLVECGHLASGRDADTPAQAAGFDG